ncbi:MAG TPA: polysaccharide deacetylase family protein [Blastocatellia bacterium]|nr:polysaccharide deacetylase family protein [Blastocatellia bacterium]
MATGPGNGNTDSMKQTLVSLMHGAGAFAPFRMLNRHKALILMYHRFRETADGVSTSARCFAEQLDYLSEHYRIVPLSELARYLASGRPVPPGLAVITIDDGYRDCYDIAFPILRERKIPATTFVVTDFVDQATWLWTDKVRYLTASAAGSVLEATIEDHPLKIALDGRYSRLKGAERVNTELKLISDEAKEDAICEIAETLGVKLPNVPPPDFLPLTWEQIRELDSSGVEVGSHTVTHPILTRITGEKLRYELRGSRARLEDVLGHKVELLGYPNGDHNLAVQHEAARAGYTCAVTADYGLNNGRSNLLALKRIHTEHDIAHFVKSTSGFEQFKNTLIHYGGGAAGIAVDQSTN